MEKTDTLKADEILLSTAPPDISPFSTFSAISTGFFAGALAQSLTTPIQNIIQLNEDSYSLIDSIQEQYQRNGFKSFWKGNISRCLTTVPKSTLQFFLYHTFLNPAAENNRMNRIAAGSLSSFITDTILYPISSIIKHRESFIENQSSAGIFSSIQDMYRKYGIFSFYRGYFNNLPFSFLAGSIKSSLFAEISKSYRIRQSIIERVYISTTTSIFSELITYPIYAIQKNVYNIDETENIISTITRTTKEMYHNRKLLGFYEGFASRFFEKVPIMTLNFIFLEEVRRFLDNRMKTVAIITPIKPREKAKTNEPPSLRTWRWF